MYSEEYKRQTGIAYTPECFVKKQNEILNQHYNMDDFIVFDPCVGTGNLENLFDTSYKQHCYLSTLENLDVEVCKNKGFNNVIQYDYVKNDEQPKWLYNGKQLDVNEICNIENKKLMVIMNPPFVTDGKDNLALKFFKKVLKLNPQVIVFYYMTESFLKNEIDVYIKSGYKIVSHIFSNAKIFNLSNWSISQVVFDKEQGDTIDRCKIKTDRYELEKGNFNYIKTYCYDNSRPKLTNLIDRKIKENRSGIILGNVCYICNIINLTNKTAKNSNLIPITTDNLMWCLLSKGINFNTNVKYFERSSMVYRGEINEIPEELFNDSIMFSLFYKGCAFTNKGYKNYIMPFTAEELNCKNSDLNVLYPTAENYICNLFVDNNKPFDFREFLSQFNFSKEAKNLYNAALEIVKYYHSNNEYINKNWNDSFYDITNAITRKNPTNYKQNIKNTKRINNCKNSTGLRFSDKYIEKITDVLYFQAILYKFFEFKKELAKKINKQLVDSKLLLWERENMF